MSRRPAIADELRARRGPQRDRLVARPRPLLVDDTTAAAICGVSRRAWRSLVRDGQAPGPVAIGAGGGRRPIRVARWSIAALEAWVATGCPAVAKSEGR